MRNLFKYFAAVVSMLISFSAFSQDSTAVKSRPKIGLVLSGGGAKGAAHIGVIKYLEEAVTFKELCLFSALHLIPGTADHFHLYSSPDRITTCMADAMDYTHRLERVPVCCDPQGI